MSRTRVRRRRLVVTSAAVFLGAPLAGPVGHALEARPVPAAPHRYVVRPGDTLWSIAKRTSPGQDPRLVVDAIAAANDIDPGALVPGSTLVIATAG